MAGFPIDFNEILDSQGIPLGGFGGNPEKDRAYHIDFIRKSGKAPVVFVHGNTGTATHAQWGWLKVINELTHAEFGYSQEHFWALSYLGSGHREIKDAYTSNVEDLRAFTDYVRSYLEVDCVDMVGHSLGCHLILCYLGGLKGQSDPIVWDRGTRYENVGSVILLDGAMNGLSSFTYLPRDEYDEWLLGHDVYKCLNPDPTPFGRGETPTSPPRPHNVRYWTCMARGGYVDQMDNNHGVTGHLDGADKNEDYNMGYGILSHEKVKDEPAVIRDWAPYLNSVPPADPVVIGVDRDSGNYQGQVTVSVVLTPETAGPVEYTANRVVKEVASGTLVSRVAESVSGSLAGGESLTLDSPGMWELEFSAESAQTVYRHYWLDVVAPNVEFLTDNSVPFNGSLLVQARTDSGLLFMNNGGDDEYGWIATSSMSVTETTLIKAMAIQSDGIASEIETRKFKKVVLEQVTGTVAEHYVASRLNVNEFLQYGAKYGYMQRFTLYKIDGVWTDTDDTAPSDSVAPTVTCSHDSGTYWEPITVSLTATDDQDPSPRIYYSTDGSTPSPASPHVANRARIEVKTPGLTTLKFHAGDRSGNTSELVTREYDMVVEDSPPLITANVKEVFHTQAIAVTLTASDETDRDVTVYYTLDGTVPKADSPSFVNTIEIPLSTNGNHAVSCKAKDSAGNETFTVFHYVIEDARAPETGIFPPQGPFRHSVTLSLSTNEPVAWTRYTLDGSDPDETNGQAYQGAFTLTESAQVKYRSKDIQGNLEEIKTADYTLQTEPVCVCFENIEDCDGYIKAGPDGGCRSVANESHLALGAGWDGMISRSIVSFDTSSLPQNAHITRAYVQITYYAGWGNPWESARLALDVKHGKFGSETLCEPSDWDEPATAPAAAWFDPFYEGSCDSTDFSHEGIAAINTSGRTQMRLYFSPHDDMGPLNYLFIEKGASVLLFVEYI